MDFVPFNQKGTQHELPVALQPVDVEQNLLDVATTQGDQAGCRACVGVC